MDNLGDVRLFVEAAHLGGLSAAGRKLGLSPAAASARLFKLESVLHTRLFELATAACAQRMKVEPIWSTASRRSRHSTMATPSCKLGKARCAEKCGSPRLRTSAATCSRTGLTSSTSNTPK